MLFDSAPIMYEDLDQEYVPYERHHMGGDLDQ